MEAAGLPPSGVIFLAMASATRYCATATEARPRFAACLALATDEP